MRGPSRIGFDPYSFLKKVEKGLENHRSRPREDWATHGRPIRTKGPRCDGR